MNMPLALSRSTIREWRLDDAASLARHANNRNVVLNLRDMFPHPYGLSDAEKFLSTALAEQPRQRFCIEIDRAAVGGIGIHPQEDVHRFSAELGYWLAEDFWGKGIMSEAVAAFTDWAFTAFELRRIFAQAFSSNPASARVLEKTGFVLEGRLKNHVFKNGELMDSLLYARTR